MATIHDALDSLDDLANAHAAKWRKARQALDRAGIDASTIGAAENDFEKIVDAISDASDAVEAAIKVAVEEAVREATKAA